MIEDWLQELDNFVERFGFVNACLIVVGMMALWVVLATA